MQPVFSPSLLVDIMRPDGSSTIPLLNGESLSADLAHELMGIQVIIEKESNFLFSHITFFLLIECVIVSDPVLFFFLMLQGTLLAWCFPGIYL